MSRTRSSGKQKIGIVGAGPAGLSAAYQLVKEGYEVDLYEAADAVGGMCRTMQLWNHKVDVGPHRFFSNNLKVNKLWLEVVGKEYSMVNRLTRIYYNKKFYNYPIKPFNAFFNLGPVQSFLCVLSYAKEKIFPTKQDGTLESWVTSRFGRRLFGIFFKTYTERLWGLKCTELDADWSAQRIKGFSLKAAILGAVFSSAQKKYKTLVDQFAYPHKGTGYVYQKMADDFKKWGGKLCLNTPIKRILIANKKVRGVELDGGIVKDYDIVITTMPFTTMVSGLDKVPARVKEHVKKLKFRNTILVYLEMDKVNLFPDNWLYIHSPEAEVGRITNFNNWGMHLNPDIKTTVLCMEYWSDNDDAIWQLSDEEIIKKATKDIYAIGLVGDARMLNGQVYKIPKCYPVYHRGYMTDLEPVQKYLDTIGNLVVIGRYGAFKYNNQDHSMYMGIMAAENVVKGEHNSLWEINTDFENYQESASITESGLVVKEKI